MPPNCGGMKAMKVCSYKEQRVATATKVTAISNRVILQRILYPFAV
jgi:hypothetical protein